MDTLRVSIERATRSGALACAPRELALARAHYDFAQTELEIGNATRAEQHIALAEQNVGAAQVLTPERGCQSVRDEVPAIPSSSLHSHSVTRALALRSFEADGGGLNATLPAGAVNDVCLTAHVYGETRLDEALPCRRTCYQSAILSSSKDAAPDGDIPGLGVGISGTAVDGPARS